jgi:galactosamine-6-phosphate isomerase
MLDGLASKPAYGISTGLADILQSRKILLLVNGPAKREAMRRLLQEPISTQFPGSFLRLHPDALCLHTADTVEGNNP